MTITIDTAAARIATAPANAELLVWTPACRAGELELEWGEAMLVGAKQVALFRVASGEIFAVCNRDPHTGSPVMSRGIVGSRGKRATIASPLLKQVYDLETGECLGDPGLFLRPFRTRIREGVVEVEVPA